MSSNVSRVVFFSGGMSSFFTAVRVAEKYGTTNLTLLFTDTSYEDEDLYRFLKEGAAYVGGNLIQLKDGRNPWQVFEDVKFLGNSQVDPCSRILKREPAKKWITENFPDPDSAVLYLGMNWDEEHRLDRSKIYWNPYQLEGILFEPPLMNRDSMMAELERIGIKPPRLYALGFPHNNCGGFCIKAGHAHFKLLLEKLPDKYAEAEEREEHIRNLLDKDVAIMRDRRGGTATPLTMKEFRSRNTSELDLFEWGGCGCFTDIPEEELEEGNNDNSPD